MDPYAATLLGYTVVILVLLRVLLAHDGEPWFRRWMPWALFAVGGPVIWAILAIWCMADYLERP